MRTTVSLATYFALIRRAAQVHDFLASPRAVVVGAIAGLRPRMAEEDPCNQLIVDLIGPLDRFDELKATSRVLIEATGPGGEHILLGRRRAEEVELELAALDTRMRMVFLAGTCLYHHSTALGVGYLFDAPRRPNDTEQARARALLNQIGCLTRAAASPLLAELCNALATNTPLGPEIAMMWLDASPALEA